MKYLIAAIVLAIPGTIYTFVSPKKIILWGIAILPRHNDRVLVGILCLLLACIFIFRYFKKN